MAENTRKTCHDTGRKESIEAVYDWFYEGFDTGDFQDAKAFLDEL